MFGKEAKQGHGPEAFGNRLFAALRLPNGNTLIATGNGHSVLEVTPEKEIVWQIHQDDLPGIRLAWVTTIEVLAQREPRDRKLPCRSGPAPVDRNRSKDQQVVWTLDRHADFGNNVSNSLLVDLVGAIDSLNR